MGSVVPAAWTVATVGGGSVYMQQSGHGGRIVLATGAVNGDSAQISFNGNGGTPGTNCLAAGVGVVSQMIWRGYLDDGVGAGNATNVNVVQELVRLSAVPVEYISVDFDTAAGDATWWLNCTDGAGTTSVNTGVTPDYEDHWYKLAISSTLVNLYIDDMETPVATCRANIPLWNMEPLFSVQARAAADRKMRLDFVALIPDVDSTG